MGKIFVIMGKSSTGKDTIFKELLLREELDLKTVVTYTTRPIRNGEVDGREYFFVSETRWKELEEENRVIEHRAYNTVHGVWHYFTADDGQIDLKEYNYLMISTLEGYREIRSFYGKEIVVPIYIEVETGIRLERALAREKSQAEPKYTEMCRRFLADEADFSIENLNFLNITKSYENMELESCLQQIIGDIQKEKNVIY